MRDEHCNSCFFLAFVAQYVIFKDTLFSPVSGKEYLYLLNPCIRTYHWVTVLQGAVSRRITTDMLFHLLKQLVDTKSLGNQKTWSRSPMKENSLQLLELHTSELGEQQVKLLLISQDVTVNISFLYDLWYRFVTVMYSDSGQLWAKYFKVLHKDFSIFCLHLKF